jgi:hypothetical protein
MPSLGLEKEGISKSLFALGKSSGISKKYAGFPYHLLYCLNFDGIDDRIKITGNPFDYSIDTPFSFVTFFKNNFTGLNKYLFNKQNATQGIQFFQFSSADQIIWKFQFPSSFWQVVSPTPYNDNKWHLAGGTYNGSGNRNGMNLYIDGNLKATGSANVATENIQNTDQLYIGSSRTGTYFQGKMCLPMIFNAELTATEMSRLYNYLEIPYTKLVSIWGRVKKPEPSLLATTIYDEKNANDGIVTGMTWEELKKNL